MGFRKNWDVAGISSQLHTMSRECSSSYTDGFTAFEIKKELYLIQEIVERALRDAPDFGELEKDWLTEQEQKRIIRILKSKE